MNKRLREAVKKASRKQTEADCAIKEIEQHLAFCGFREEEPRVSACSGGEIILEYKGFEMPIEEAILNIDDKSHKITYTTDVAHCMGRDCPIRDKCVRFYNHQRAHVFSNECVPYTEEQYDYETEQCEMYKPTKQ